MPEAVVHLRIDAVALQDTVAWLEAECIGTPGQLAARYQAAGESVVPHGCPHGLTVERALGNARGLGAVSVAVRQAAEALSRESEGTIGDADEPEE